MSAHTPHDVPAAGDPLDAPVSLDEVVALELGLFDDPERAGVVRIDELLHEDFEQLSPTGRVYDAVTFLDPAPEDALRGLTCDHLAAQLVAPGAVLVTYRAHRGERQAWRSSLWLRTPAGWRLRHHQGTPIRGFLSV